MSFASCFPSSSLLYGICDEETCMRFQMEPIKFADLFFSAGGDILQYRNKLSSSNDYLQTGLNISLLARRYPNKRVIFNEYYEDILNSTNMTPYMLHFGQEDLKNNVLLLERCKKNNISFGISTHNEQELIHSLKYNPAYIAVGLMFSSSTKPDVELSSINVEKVLHFVKQPLVYIGGITLSNIKQLYWKKGFQFAVISDIFSYGASQVGFQRYISEVNTIFKSYLVS